MYNYSSLFHRLTNPLRRVYQIDPIDDFTGPLSSCWFDLGVVAIENVYQGNKIWELHEIGFTDNTYI